MNRPARRGPGALVAAASRRDPGDEAAASIETLMTWALWLELDAVERYRELADVMETHNNTEVAQLFRRMEAVEGKHAASILAQQGWTAPPPRPPGPPPWVGLPGPESVAHESIHYLMRPWHALTLALEGEEQARRFFETLAAAAPTAEVRAAALELAEEEREHAAAVRAWLARVPCPDDDWHDDPDPPRYLD